MEGIQYTKLIWDQFKRLKVEVTRSIYFCPVCVPRWLITREWNGLKVRIWYIVNSKWWKGQRYDFVIWKCDRVANVMDSNPVPGWSSQSRDSRLKNVTNRLIYCSTQQLLTMRSLAPSKHVLMIFHPDNLLYVYFLTIASFTERSVQQQIPSSFGVILIILLSGNNHGWRHSIHLNVSYCPLPRRDRPYSMITHCVDIMDMYLNRCRRPSIWAWTCMNNYRGTSILTWQSRRLTGPEHSLQGTFNHVLRRSRLHVIPLLYAQWWSMPPLLGLPTLCRTAINWNRSSDMLLGLHATGTRKQPAWQQWWTISSGSHWRPDRA